MQTVDSTGWETPAHIGDSSGGADTGTYRQSGNGETLLQSIMKVRKADIVLIAGIVFLSGLLWTVPRVLAARGATVIVRIDGEETAQYPLSEEDEVRIDTAYGVNTLVIRGGQAFLTDADCPDRLCVKQGRIDKTGQSIICLPHRLVIAVEDAADPDVDAATQ